MVNIIPPDEIEELVGSARLFDKHVGRVITAERRFVLMHSEQCLQEYDDLRDCPYSQSMQSNFYSGRWESHRDEAMLVELDRETGVLYPRYATGAIL